MLFATPSLPSATQRKLTALDALHAQLAAALAALTPSRRSAMSRVARATAVAASTSIEGFRVAPSEALALLAGEVAPDPDQPAQLAVENYARAIEHVDILSSDPSFRWFDRVLLDLHHDACSFQRDKDPGLWRTSPVGVIDGAGRVVYQAPPADQVPQLMHEIVEWLDHGDRDAHVVVRAAMAHLHVVSVHPFKDGNGRISRIVQSLVLARDGLLNPGFSSIEQYLDEHTQAYYEQLQHAHGSAYGQRCDAGDWVAFCIEAHLDQARRRLAQTREAPPRYVAGGEGPSDLGRAAERHLRQLLAGS